MSSDDHQPSNPIICTVDPYQFLELKRNLDGTITRLTETPSTPATPDPSSSSSPSLSKDFPLNPTHKTSLRFFLPKQSIPCDEGNNKLPVILYFHGGGFVFHHAGSAMFHDFCSKAAARLGALVASLEYRLAPEHRLPAAYDDALDALRWIGTSAECHWLTQHGDLSNVFLMGSSAGGNIAYHALLRAALAAEGGHFQPLIIRGAILHQPFFGGPGRTGSEARLVNDRYVPLSASDLLWELGLPPGSGRAHEFCDPRAGYGPGALGRVRELGWRVLVTGREEDPLVDRGAELVEMLRERGVGVVGWFKEGGYHAVEIFDPNECSDFLDVVKDFMIGSCLAAQKV